MGEIIPLRARTSRRDLSAGQMQVLVNQRLAGVSRDLVSITSKLNGSLADLRTFIVELPDSESREALLRECHRIVGALGQVQDKLPPADCASVPRRVAIALPSRLPVIMA